MTAELRQPEALHVVGASVARNDGVGFVTGRAQYSADLAFPGMLHLRMVRSPSHHARIRGVDLSAAREVPGFVRALTHEDVLNVLATANIHSPEDLIKTPIESIATATGIDMGDLARLRQRAISWLSEVSS